MRASVFESIVLDLDLAFLVRSSPSSLGNNQFWTNELVYTLLNYLRDKLDGNQEKKTQNVYSNRESGVI